MKWLPLAGLLCAAALASENPQLKQVQSVYILPMSAGLDQYIANQLTKQGLLQVVTDPQKADAILTDRIGETFERRLDELYPPPPKPEPEKKKDETAKEDKDQTDKSPTFDFGPPINRPSPFNRGKGTYFLVDRKSRNVVWSVYQRPRNSRPDELERTADRIVRKLKRDITGKNSETAGQ